jgi:hypothetical protein
MDKFSEVAVGGACPKCGGRQFQQPDPVQEGKRMGGWGLTARLSTAMVKGDLAKQVECVTCGARFLRG